MSCNLYSTTEETSVYIDTNTYSKILVKYLNCSQSTQNTYSGGVTPKSSWILVDAKRVQENLSNEVSNLSYKHKYTIDCILKSLLLQKKLNFSIVDAISQNNEFLNLISANNPQNTPFFIKPEYISERLTDIEYYVADFSYTEKNTSLNITLIPKGNLIPLWQIELIISPNKNHTASFTLPGRILVEGKYILKIENQDTFKSNSIELLITNKQDNTAEEVAILCYGKQLSKGLGIGCATNRNDFTVILTMGNSILEHNTGELTNAIQSTKNGGVTMFLSPSNDTFKILHNAGVLPELIEVKKLNSSQNFYCIGDENLFYELPDIERNFFVWDTMYPKTALTANIGKNYCEVILPFDNQNYSAVLEVEYGLGKIIFTTFNWLNALSISNIADIFLNRLIKFFEQSKLPEIPLSNDTTILNTLNNIKEKYRKYRVIGPFTIQHKSNSESSLKIDALATIFKPEEINSSKETFIVNNERTLRWREIYTHNHSKSKINLIPFINSNKNSIIYLTTEVNQDGRHIVEIDSIYPFRLILNNQLIFEKPTGYNGELKLNLKKINNTLIFKVFIQNTNYQNASICLKISTSGKQ